MHGVYLIQLRKFSFPYRLTVKLNQQSIYAQPLQDGLAFAFKTALMLDRAATVVRASSRSGFFLEFTVVTE